MKKLCDIIPREFFYNAFEICCYYANSKTLNDINILLLKDSFNKLNLNKIKDYYDNYIVNDKFYANPILFSNDVVQIPKGLNNFREYRFFDIYSMILYNAVGILFYNLCESTLDSVDSKLDSIFPYGPTIFKFDNKYDNSKKFYKPNYRYVKADKDYSDDYTNYINKLKENIVDNTCIIKIDISKYFNSITHKRLVSLINEYSLSSCMAKYDIDEEALKILEFYFDSMMKSKLGIPQGRDNCFSDYFGNIYLRELDFKIKDLCESSILKFKCMVRYVDDITIVFEVNDKYSNACHFKELSSITQKISTFLLENLNLVINQNKTEFHIFKKKIDVDSYFDRNAKKVSTKNLIKYNDSDLKNMYFDFKNTLSKFKFNSDSYFSFKLDYKEKEILKYVFNPSFLSYIMKDDNLKELNDIISKLNLELTIDYLYILIILFFSTKKSSSPFLHAFIKNVNTNLLFSDKRTIHIAMLAFTQQGDKIKLKKIIEKNKDILIKDNYGKYLVTLAHKYIYNNEFSCLDSSAIYNSISCRYIDTSKRMKYINNGNCIYDKMIEKYIQNSNCNLAQIQQLNNFVNYYNKNEWDFAFNYFYNFFHETCKIYFNKVDENNYTMKKIIPDLYKTKIINQSDNLYLLKFADNRNFNSISHPSKNGKMSKKVNKIQLDYFIEIICQIIIKIL